MADAISHQISRSALQADKFGPTPTVAPDSIGAPAPSSVTNIAPTHESQRLSFPPVFAHEIPELYRTSAPRAGEATDHFLIWHRYLAFMGHDPLRPIDPTLADWSNCLRFTGQEARRHGSWNSVTYTRVHLVMGRLAETVTRWLPIRDIGSWPQDIGTRMLLARQARSLPISAAVAVCDLDKRRISSAEKRQMTLPPGSQKDVEKLERFYRLPAGTLIGYSELAYRSVSCVSDALKCESNHSKFRAFEQVRSERLQQAIAQDSRLAAELPGSLDYLSWRLGFGEPNDPNFPPPSKILGVKEKSEAERSKALDEGRSPTYSKEDVFADLRNVAPGARAFLGWFRRFYRHCLTSRPTEHPHLFAIADYPTVQTHLVSIRDTSYNRAYNTSCENFAGLARTLLKEGTGYIWLNAHRFKECPRLLALMRSQGVNESDEQAVSRWGKMLCKATRDNIRTFNSQQTADARKKDRDYSLDPAWALQRAIDVETPFKVHHELLTAIDAAYESSRNPEERFMLARGGAVVALEALCALRARTLAEIEFGKSGHIREGNDTNDEIAWFMRLTPEIMKCGQTMGNAHYMNSDIVLPAKLRGFDYDLTKVIYRYVRERAIVLDHRRVKSPHFFISLYCREGGRCNPHTLSCSIRMLTCRFMSHYSSHGWGMHAFRHLLAISLARAGLQHQIARFLGISEEVARAHYGRYAIKMAAQTMFTELHCAPALGDGTGVSAHTEIWPHSSAPAA